MTFTLLLRRAHVMQSWAALPIARTLRKLTVPFVAGIVLGIAMLMPAPPSSNAVGSGYVLYPDRWYQDVADTGSYVSWMTLPYDVDLRCTGTLYCDSATWSSPISQAASVWSSTSTTIYFQPTAFNYWNDVHVYVWHDPAAYTSFGFAVWFDENYVLCPVAGDCPASGSRPNRWWWSEVALNNGAVWFSTAIFPTNNAPLHRQPLASHENRTFICTRPL